jgi:hypothetical protein
MQLRNQGHDVLYLPEPQILHLAGWFGEELFKIAA